jgi:hypothetical protein
MLQPATGTIVGEREKADMTWVRVSQATTGTRLTSPATPSWIVKKIKMFYIIHMISILNFIFTVVF